MSYASTTSLGVRSDAGDLRTPWEQRDARPVRTVAAIQARGRAPEEAGDQSIPFTARQKVADANAARPTDRPV
jgi:hypothetical protein